MFANRSRTLLLTLAALVAPGCGQETFKAPPDCEGRHLVAYARRPVAGGQADIYLFDYDGNGYRAIPALNDPGRSDLSPALSADGRFVAFERELGPTESDVLIYDRCQDAILPQPGLNSAGRETQPAFSSNGLRLAFVRDTVGGPRVRLYDGTNDRLVPLPALESTAAYADSAPSINHDGSLIAFVSTRNGNPDVLVFDVGGDSLWTLPDLASPASDTDPFLTPDGHYLVFASDRTGGTGGFDLYLYDLGARSFVAVSSVLNSPESERAPSINPTSDRIVFESTRGGGVAGSDLWLYTRSSGLVERLGASTSSDDLQPWIVWY